MTTIADIDLKTAQETAARLHIPSVLEDYHAILADPTIDAVAICSSTDTHAKIIVEAANAGKHIFCEKPIDHDLAKIDAALETVQKAGVKLQIGFNRRFDPNFAALQKRVRQGAVGEVELATIISPDPAPPPAEYVRARAACSAT